MFLNKQDVEDVLEKVLKRFKGEDPEKEDAIKELEELRREKTGLQKDLDSKAKEVSAKQIELDELQAKKEREDVELKHNLKILQEKNEVELMKKEEAIKSEFADKKMELMQEHQGKINELTKEFADRQEKALADQMNMMSQAINVDISKTN
jgi:Skp family chaperone for outer membrane proteins